MKIITYNPETHVLVPVEPSGEMCDAATADSCWENMNPPPSTAYRLMLAAAPQPEQVDSESVAEVLSLFPGEHNSYMNVLAIGVDPYNIWSFPQPGTKLYTTPQPDRTAELEAALKVAKDNIHSAKLCEFNSMSSRHEMLRLMNSVIAKINEVLK
mgnify:CR=1 FL=1